MTLAEYVGMIMSQKNLTPFAVQKRSGNSVSDSYVAGIIGGRVKQPSVAKLKSLAQGLGVDKEELVMVAVRGDSEPAENPWPGQTILHVMERIMSNPDLTVIVKALCGMSDIQLHRVKKSIIEPSAGN